ncbi:hypothetical protein K0504_03230 [Neiella marina]|uniref:Uncharacterized protein n=1 Tax=Neiella holothuriorum TaxID=2870530 RepID=A0ABS7ECL1_9GAMM|nr:hypothetical protein [Neiella holothuriorum]MBW8190036.1 hypothetical protein [Neiella holothuriorum]
MSPIWQLIESINLSEFMLAVAWLLVFANWRSPIIRNIALANVLIGLVGSQLMSYLATLPLEQYRYYWYLGASTINFVKALFILALISLNIAYMCKTSAQLMTIFTLLGLLNIARFIDRFVFDSGASGSWLGTSYSILVPALNALALIALAIPVVQRLRSNSKQTSR